MFINFSNHPSDRWEADQREAADLYGKIMDISFPNVPPAFDENEIKELAQRCVDEICTYTSESDVVMVQGEFSLTYAVVNALKNRGLRVVSACSERIVEEFVDKDGNLARKSVFKFVRFREYA